ncbi:hypothetical protein CTI12_AA095500 [Artemisia annua]|uniref:Uncharacterized protein n=1 Tax=Artemisia annua TaxID=35608 RepID=A0A2U1KA50_ARTAN|nr:hypothetical protein CTI12_AA626800 [Artemisia annua]PWA91021.1 hypothetical protein CTI12_AA095500 [Artemisia annua]
MEIEIISKESIKPSSPTPPDLKTFKLSILDQLFVIPYVPIVLYYPDRNGNNVFQALERSVVLKKSLSETLVQFYPLAGTIKSDFSIDCNDVGANYVLALVHSRLDDFLHHPDHRLIHKFLPFRPSFDESSGGARVLHVQVNIFRCGGITIGLCVSHKIVDAAALYTFLKGWANMACGAIEVVYPNLTAPSLFPATSFWMKEKSMDIAKSVLKQGKSCTKRFVFGSNAIATLKEEAHKNGVQQPTRVEVVSALIWKCAMATSKEACGFQKQSRLTHFVNLRRKLATTMSKDFICNMVWISSAVCLASCETTLHDLVEKVRKGISKIDPEFVKKAQGDEGYIEMQKSLEEQIGEIGAKGTIDNYNFTSWCKMGFHEIDFGWGNPSWVTGPVGDGVPVFMNLVTLMDTNCGEGIEAWVVLDEKEMEILQRNQEILTYASLDPSPLAK